MPKKNKNPVVPLFDGHNDALLRLWDKRLDPEVFVTGATTTSPGTAHLDLPRARKGGFCGGFFAMFVPTPRAIDPTEKKRSAKNQKGQKDPTEGQDAPAKEPLAGSKKDSSYRIPRAGPIDFELATEATIAMLGIANRLVELEALEVILERSQLGDGWQDLSAERPLKAILHLEGAEAVARDMSNLEDLYARGIRSIGPVWSRSNDFGHGVPFAYPATPDVGPGLTEAGRDLVRACNEVGILIDLAHLNLAGFLDVAGSSQHPLVSTHTAVHALAPTARNLLDEQIDAIGDSDGLIGVNLHVADLRSDGRWNSDTPLERWAEHVEYIIERIGVRHVALGSDFDGALMPRSLGDAAGLQALVATLRDRGVSEPDLDLLATGNWLRVLDATWN